MITDLKELLAALNADPDPSEIKKNEDGSTYIPISKLQSKLDNFFGVWSWEFQQETIGKYAIIGKGVLTVMFPEFGDVVKSGTAGVDVSGLGMKMDYPRLEAMCILNAAKKLGVAFGRNLNRDKDDAALPVTQLREKNNEDDEIDKELKVVTALVQRAETKEEALDIMKRTGFGFNMQMKEIAQSKPSKQTA